MDNTVLTLASVFLGGILGLLGTFLAPYVNSKIEKRGQKARSKTEFIETVFIFFNYRKQYFVSFNWLSFFNAVAPHLRNELKNEQDESKQIDLAKQYEEVRQHIEKESTDLAAQFEKLIHVEGKIHGQLIEIQSHYGDKVYSKISSLLTPHLKASNDDTNIYEYRRLTNAELKKLGRGLAVTLETSTREMQNKCDKLIERFVFDLKSK